ncbi:MAG: glycosyltransferase [Pseudomonadales bacterium]
MTSSSKVNKLSIIVPVCERTRDVADHYYEYKQYCDELADHVEYIYVVASDDLKTVSSLRALKDKQENLTLLVLNRNYGEATAIEAGFSKASGDLILTLPPYLQVESSDLQTLFDQIDEYDMVLAKRSPRLDGMFNRAQTKTFNFLLNSLSHQEISDIGCGVRLIKPQVLKEVHIYGDQHRFLPLLAHQLGFSYIEVPLRQSPADSGRRLYGPGIYSRRILDLLTIVFLTKFNKKPLRFFGLLGGSAIAVGTIGLIYLAIDRLVFSNDLADRPLLVLFTLFFTLGFQLMAIGLVGETVIFTHSKENKEYMIKEIFN